MRIRLLALGSAVLIAIAIGCGSSSDSGATGATTARGSENVGQSCKVPTDCFPGLTVKGDVQCLDRVTGGYCTHLCTKDEDCCSVPGECKTGFAQLCAPFESTGKSMCFLSCEKSDLHAAPDAGAGAPVLDDNTYCSVYAGTAFSCRSTGGGKDNRKVCVPGGTSTTGDAG